MKIDVVAGWVGLVVVLESIELLLKGNAEEGLEVGRQVDTQKNLCREAIKCLYTHTTHTTHYACVRARC